MYLFDETKEAEDEEDVKQEVRLLKVDMHCGKRKSLACLRTVCSHVEVSLSLLHTIAIAAACS